MIKHNGINLSSSANTYTMLITGEKDISVHRILASSLPLFIFATTMTQYIVILAFTVEPSPVGVGAGTGVVLGAKARDVPSLVVLAFLGKQSWSLGIPVVACFTVVSNGFLALGKRLQPQPIPLDDALVTWVAALACSGLAPSAQSATRVWVDLAVLALHVLGDGQLVQPILIAKALTRIICSRNTRNKHATLHIVTSLHFA